MITLLILLGLCLGIAAALYYVYHEKTGQILFDLEPELIVQAVSILFLPLATVALLCVIIAVLRRQRSQEDVMATMLHGQAQFNHEQSETAIQVKLHHAQLHDQLQAIIRQSEVMKAAMEAGDAEDGPTGDHAKLVAGIDFRNEAMLQINTLLSHFIQALYRVDLNVQSSKGRSVRDSQIYQRFVADGPGDREAEWKNFGVRELLWSQYDMGDRLIFFQETNRLLQTFGTPFMKAFLEQNQGFVDALTDIVAMRDQCAVMAREIGVVYFHPFSQRHLETRVINQLAQLLTSAGTTETITPVEGDIIRPDADSMASPVVAARDDIVMTPGH